MADEEEIRTIKDEKLDDEFFLLIMKYVFFFSKLMNLLYVNETTNIPLYPLCYLF
jgi:hypothetical protein